jgi:serine/threonine protein kinase
MARLRNGKGHVGLHMTQRLGECLGKGAFGSVYKAFNWGTGEAVAIKQIKLGDLPRSELRMIEVWKTRDWKGRELTRNP